MLRKGYSFDIIKQALANIRFDPAKKMSGQALLSQLERKHGVDTVRNLVVRDLNNRVKQAMYQKGIPFERIDQFIEKKENEEDDRLKKNIAQ